MARWSVVTYGKAVDRGTFVRAFVAGLEARGIKVGGFAQERKTDSAGGTTVELVRLGRPDRLVLGGSTGKQADAGADAVCSYSFRPEGFAEARRWLEADAAAARLLLVSEVSKLEAGGQGHHAALAWALALSDKYTVVFVARADQLSYLVEKLAPPGEPVGYLELPASADATGAFVAELVAASAQP